MGVRAQIIAGVLGVGAAVAPVGDGLDPMRQSAALALSAGLTHDQAVMATAIAVPESGSTDTALGDTTITDDTWGPSYGRWQIRCIWDAPEGSTRDCSGSLHDPVANARAMFEISGGGTNWRPWTGYLTGAYQDSLADAERAVSDVERAGGIAPLPTSSSPAGSPTTDRSPGGFARNLWSIGVRSWLRTGQIVSVVPGGRTAWEQVDSTLFPATTAAPKVASKA